MNNARESHDANEDHMTVFISQRCCSVFPSSRQVTCSVAPSTKMRISHSILRFRSHQHPSRRRCRPPPPSFTLTARILSASESTIVMLHQQVYSLPPPSCTHHSPIHSFCSLTTRGRFAVSSSLSGIGAFGHSLFRVFVGFNTTLEHIGYSGVRRKDARMVSTSGKFFCPCDLKM